MQRTLGGDPPGCRAVQPRPSVRRTDRRRPAARSDRSSRPRASGTRFIRPTSIWRACLVDGHWWCVPVNIHSWNWAWTSIPAFEKAGVPSCRRASTSSSRPLRSSRKPASSRSPSAARKLADPAALQDVVTSACSASRSARRCLTDKSSRARRGPEMQGRLRRSSVRSRSSRTTAPPTATGTTPPTSSMTDQAGTADHGRLGSWRVRRLPARSRASTIGCIARPDRGQADGHHRRRHLPVPQAGRSGCRSGPAKLASMMVNPQVQALFNNAKGSMPIRDDVDMSLADDCMEGAEIGRRPGQHRHRDQPVASPRTPIGRSTTSSPSSAPTTR